MNPTTEFDYLMKRALKILDPKGKVNPAILPTSFSEGYNNIVKPDYVLSNQTWIDFKLHVSYREKYAMAWKPSALYSSLRKYIDHSANTKQRLVIIYGKLHGTEKEIIFPIKRGRKILVNDLTDFRRRVILVSADRVVRKLGPSEASIGQEINRLISQKR